MVEYACPDNIQAEIFKSKGREMIEEIREVYGVYLKGEGHLVKQIRIINKELTDLDVYSLALIVPILPEIPELVLKNNNLNPSSFKKVLESVRDNAKLKKLWIIENNLEDSDIYELCRVLEGFMQLEFIHLDGNKLSRDCTKELAVTLGGLKELKGISVRGNEISHGGLMNIAKSIKSHAYMEYFYFSTENVEENEILSLKNVLRHIQIAEYF